MNASRPLAITLAAVLLGLVSIASLIPSPSLEQGVPVYVTYSSYVLGALGVVAMLGLWLRKRWGMWLAIGVSAVNIPSAAPGIVFAPTTIMWLLATIGVIWYVAIIALVLIPRSRHAYV
jgi:uncharacterized membrane protein (DUF2068 family)